MNKIYCIGDEEELVADMPKIINKRIKAELEEIKAEINAKERVELSTKEMWYNFALADITHIIDNHISELKGENNG